MKGTDLLKDHFGKTGNLNTYFNYFRTDNEFVFLENLRNRLYTDYDFMEQTFDNGYLNHKGFEELILYTLNGIDYTTEDEKVIYTREPIINDLLLLLKIDLANDVFSILDEVESINYLNLDEFHTNKFFETTKE